jgi:predicted PurR-regulated permease PerM
VARQAAVVSNIDTNEIMEYFKEPINNITAWLVSYNIIDADFDFYATITNEIAGVLNTANISSFFTSILSTLSALSMGAFGVLFLLFFMLNEQNMLRNIVIALVPDKDEIQTLKALQEIRELLSRYFIGLICEIVCMMTLVTVFLSILGVKNALLIGFLAGLLNVIPYLGPLIGGVVGCILGLITTLGAHQYDMILPCLLKIAGSVAAANLIDNFVLQPVIYSKSVKAHPVEIFIVIILAGKIGGVFGMLIAIPAYTVIRVIAREFFGQLKFVNALTGGSSKKDDSQ